MLKQWKKIVRKAFLTATVFIIAIASSFTASKYEVFAASIYKQATSYIQYIEGDTKLSTSFAYRMALYNGRPAYCIQPYEAMAGTFAGSGQTEDVYGESTISAWNSWTSDVKLRVQLITYFGYGYGSRTDELDYMATQEAIWDTVAPCNVYWDRLGTSHDGNMNSEVDKRKNAILSDVNNWINNNSVNCNWQIRDENGNPVYNQDGSQVNDGSNISFDNAIIGKTYTVTDTSGILSGKGSIVQNDFGSLATQSGNSFKITLDENSWNTIKRIAVNTKGADDLENVGDSMVLYASGYQNLLVRGTPSASSRGSGFEMTATNGDAKFTKRYNGVQIEGAEFTLYRNNDNGTREIVSTFVSKVEGNVIKNLKPGNYTLVETKAPNGYYKAESYTFNVDMHEGQTSVDIDEQPINYKVIKTDKQTGQPVAGVVLQLQMSNGYILDEWTTDENYHYIDSSLLQTGEIYKIHEVSVPEGYLIKGSDVTFTVADMQQDETLDSDGYVAINVENDQLDYQVGKIDVETGDYLAGATLQLLDASGNEIDRWISENKPHKIDFSKLQLGSTYTVVELEAPEGYYKASQTTSFTVGENNNVNESNIIKISNRPIKYNITKVDEQGYAQAGVELGLYSDERCTNLLESWVTTDNAHVISSTLENGKTYYIKELSTIDGFYLNDEVKSFVVNSSTDASQAEEKSITFENKGIHFYVEKRDQDGNRLAGATIQLKDESGNVLTEIISSDSDKVEIPKEYLEAGKTYYLHESQAVDGYYYPSSDAKIVVPATYSEAKSYESNYFITTITDEKIQYNIVKKDKDTGNYIAGVTLGLYESKDAQVGVDTPVIAWQTTEEPYRISDNINLQAGKTYYVKEIASVGGYYLNTEAVSFTVPNTVYNNTVMSVEFTNKKIEWRVRKVDHNGNLLTVNELNQPFTLEVYNANGTQDNIDDDTLVATLVTDDKEYATKGYFDMTKYTNLVGGVLYRVHEAQAADGYDVAPDQYVTLTYDGTNEDVQVTTMSDQPLDIHLRKVDENGNLLTTYRGIDGSNTGFILNIYDDDMLNNGASEDEALVTTIDTSDPTYIENGYADVSKYMSYQKTYRCREVGYPAGYYRAKDVVFTIDSLQGGDIVMVDPTVKAEFRKEDENGKAFLASDAENGIEFEFTLYDTNNTDDKSDDTAIAIFSTRDAGENGWIQIGQYLQENHYYRIMETKASNGYEYSSEDVYIQMPGYYEEKEGYVINVKIGTN